MLLLSEDLCDLVNLHNNPLKLGSRCLIICFLDLLFSRAHMLRILLNIQPGEGSCSDGGSHKIPASRFLILWFLYTLGGTQP